SARLSARAVVVPPIAIASATAKLRIVVFKVARALGPGLFAGDARLEALYRDRDCGFGPRNGPVERIALEGHAAGFGDQADQVLTAQALRRRRSGIVVNLLLD